LHLRVAAAAASAADLLLMEVAGFTDVIEGSMHVCKDLSASSSSSSNDCIRIVIGLKDSWGNAAAAAGVP
jgi:hypothetical protein